MNSSDMYKQLGEMLDKLHKEITKYKLGKEMTEKERLDLATLQDLEFHIRRSMNILEDVIFA